MTTTDGQGRADEVERFVVWSEHHNEEEAANVDAKTPDGALFYAVTDLHDDGSLLPEGLGAEEAFEEDFLVRRSGDGYTWRYRVVSRGPTHVGVTTLRACRYCGCADDRACEGGCAWLGPNLCSQCAMTRADAPAEADRA